MAPWIHKGGFGGIHNIRGSKSSNLVVYVNYKSINFSLVEHLFVVHTLICLEIGRLYLVVLLKSGIMSKLFPFQFLILEYWV